jgi:hypothetical protein
MKFINQLHAPVALVGKEPSGANYVGMYVELRVGSKAVEKGKYVLPLPESNLDSSVVKSLG